MQRSRFNPAISIALAITGATTVSLVWTNSAQAKPVPVQFFCGQTLKGVPATMVQPINKTKPATPIIQWSSEYFSGAGYTPATRCGIVSKKFQDAYSRNPNFVFTNTMANGEPVICAAERRGGNCTTMLYTVKRHVQDPIKTMLRLEQVRAGAASPLNESSASGESSQQYVGVQEVVAQVLGETPDAIPLLQGGPQSIQPSNSILPNAVLDGVGVNSLW